MEIRKYRIKRESDLIPLKDLWNALETGEDMTTFQTWEWHRLLLKEWLGWKLHSLYSRCFVYAAIDGDTPLMLLPVIEYQFTTKTKWFGCQKGLYLMGEGSYSDYMNAIYRSFRPEVFEALCRKLKKDFHGLPFCLSSVREDSQLSAYLTEKQVQREEETVSVSVKRRGSPEEYLASLSSKTRSNLRQALKRINRDGINYQVEIRGRIQDQQLLENMVAIHVKRMLVKNTKDSGWLHIMSSHVRKAYRKHRDLHNNIVAMSMQENEHSCVALIWMNGKLAGYEYGLREEHAIRLLQTCFDDEFRFYSPGFRGIYDFIVQCYEDESIREFDFLRGDEPYKFQLGGEQIMLYRYVI